MWPQIPLNKVCFADYILPSYKNQRNPVRYRMASYRIINAQHNTRSIFFNLFFIVSLASSLISATYANREISFFTVLH